MGAIREEAKVLGAAGRVPKLGIFIFGKNLASKTYAEKKKEEGERAGIEVRVFSNSKKGGLKIDHVIPQRALKTPKALRKYISNFLRTKTGRVDGVIIQLPLPNNISRASGGADKTQEILNAIPPKKDVDFLTTTSHGNLFDDRSSILPPTISGILKLFEEYQIEIIGKHVTFVGAGRLVGKPGSVIFRNKGASVSVIDGRTSEKTKKLLLKNSDIIISATGTPNLIQGSMLGKDQIIIDAGYAKNEKGEPMGDVDFKTVSKKASYIAPVPGGVGPMTIAMLFSNLIDVAKK